MKKIFRGLGIVFLVLFVSVTVLAEVKWTIRSDKDEMTEEITWLALSPAVTSLKKMTFPYQGVTAKLVVCNNGEKEWTYFIFSHTPNILMTNIANIREGYEIIQTRIKWDESLENIDLIQNWGSSALHFRDGAAAIKKIASCDSVLLELNWFGDGKVHFRFPLEGSLVALKTIREKFD